MRPYNTALAPRGSSRGHRPDNVRFTVAELRSAPGIYSIVVEGKANATDYELLVEMRHAMAGLAGGDRRALEQACAQTCWPARALLHGAAARHQLAG